MVLGGGNSNNFLFSPRTLGKMNPFPPIWLEHIFQMCWTHQLVVSRKNPTRWGFFHSEFHQPMVNCWFGLVVWIPGIPSWKGLLLGYTPRIPNHRAPNQQLTIVDFKKKNISLDRWILPKGASGVATCMFFFWIPQKGPLGCPGRKEVIGSKVIGSVVVIPPRNTPFISRL